MLREVPGQAQNRMWHPDMGPRDSLISLSSIVDYRSRPKGKIYGVDSQAVAFNFSLYHSLAARYALISVRQE